MPRLRSDQGPPSLYDINGALNWRNPVTFVLPIFFYLHGLYVLDIELSFAFSRARQINVEKEKKFVETTINELLKT